MLKRSYKPEEIVAKLRQVDVLHSQVSTIADAIRQVGVSDVTFYCWRKEFGGLKTDQLKRLKELEKENERLRRAVSDLTLDKLILKEAAGYSPLNRQSKLTAGTKRGGRSVNTKSLRNVYDGSHSRNPHCRRQCPN